MKMYTNAVARMYELPFRSSQKGAEIPVYSIIEVLSVDDVFTEVIYNTKHGYIFNTLAEPYVENFPKDCVKIDNQTPEVTDFEQFWIFNGIKQVNWCGPITVCYALSISVTELRTKWELKNPSLWKRIKGGGRFSGTTSQDLMKLCELFDTKSEILETALLDENLKRSRYTPNKLMELADKGFPIVSCKIDGGTGRIRGQGIPHWILITKVEPERFGGDVFFFNPASNRIEKASWNEFISSAVQPYGIFIPIV